jgi:GTPase
MSFACDITGRGTVLAVDVLEGEIRAGDMISIGMVGGRRTVTVRSVEFIDRDIGKPTFRCWVGLMIDGVRAADVVVADEVRGAVA